ncbi:CRISPR-associated protein [Candidatus Woesearchaeota archaeon]|nr:MAG: CRISPR-associated protein [Candidatus Woesearchaeota archaeon]
MDKTTNVNRQNEQNTENFKYYDFYASFQIERKALEKSKEEIDELTTGLGKYSEIKDVLSRIMLLITVNAVRDKQGNICKLPNNVYADVYAKVGERNYSMGLKALIHSNGNYNDYLQCKLSELSLLGINSPVDLSSLPKGSWVLEFPITLTKPFISKDDIPFYIIENPVRKDRVFGVPFVSAMVWKGNLRWTMMKVFLEKQETRSNPDKFTQIRFRHTLLFGTEKGWGETKGWTEYLDDLCPNAKEKHESMLKEKFNRKNAKDVHTQGMLYFYPTFWDKIDMLVINPHDRRTKTGKNPIYFEVVPAGAKGVFRLVYVPFYWSGLSENELKKKVIEDLKDVIIGVREMMLTYGFSAKKSSGFGVIEDGWDKDESRLEVKGFYDVQRFGNFEELEEVVKNLEG